MKQAPGHVPDMFCLIHPGSEFPFMLKKILILNTKII